MLRVYLAILSLTTGGLAVTVAPVARADDFVTYEVASSDVTAANIQYSDVSGQKVLENVPLPWRTNATVINPHSKDTSLRADWEPAVGRYKWVTVRVYTHGNLLCETTLDIGDAECFGSGASYVPVPPYQWCPLPVTSCGGTYRP